MFERFEERRVLAAAFSEFVDPNPAVGNEFGMHIVPLATGNVVVTSAGDDAGGENAGAVYLFSGASGKLISTLTGSQPFDAVGRGGVTALASGNFVVLSPDWGNGESREAGAATWVSGTVGISGVVSAENSLVGSHAQDRVGSGGVVELTSGNYVVISSDWTNGEALLAGAVTWGDGSSGIRGEVSEANSLVGSTEFDGVGTTAFYNGVVPLTNGNYVVVSPYWDNDTVTDSGAVTFGNGLSGVSGTISGANSLIGTSDGDQIGINNVTALTNGNYVVSSPYWDNELAFDAGAVTFGNGISGVVGEISDGNSLVGDSEGDLAGAGVGVGLPGVTSLTNGNYVVASPDWRNGGAPFAGAVTFGSGVNGVSGVISAVNSLVGTSAGDFAGNGGITALTNGNYVVSTPNWKNGTTSGAGAATFGSGVTGIAGPVSTANSLVGSNTGDNVSFSGITALTNGNYVVGSQRWKNGTSESAGAASFGNGTTGISGAVSVANSLVGSSADDLVAGYGVTALANGNYVVRSSSWKNGTAMEAGAVTFGNGTTGTTGVISASNSLVGSNAQDFVGNRGVTALPNGNYVVSSMNWHNGELFNAGAVTFGSGTSGVTGEVNIANSLVGSSADDLVGLQDVTALAGGNYVVITPGWDFDVLLTDVGAVTLGSGTTGITGAITPANSVIGAMFADSVGQGGVMALSNGNYVVSSPFLDWDTQIDAGAVTFGNSAAGVGGTIDRSNSALGGGLATGLGLVVADNVNRNFYASFIEEDGGRVRVGSQIDGFSRPWHNVNRPMDVDNDLHVVAADALEVINFLNAGFGGPVDPEAAIGEPFGFLDVDGDDFVAPNDALDVINWLNAGLGGEGEASAESTREAGAPVRSAEWAAGPAAAVDAEELMGLLAGEWLGRRRR